MTTRIRPSCRRSSGQPAFRRLAWTPRKSAAGRSPGLEYLKCTMLARALRTFGEAHFKEPLRHAAERAADLAQATGLPLLVFPELFEEIAIAAMLQSEYHTFGRF